MGRDSAIYHTASYMHPFQSTRPHGARLDCQDIFLCLANVSIHAPAWGATYNEGETVYILTVSIHAPAWGATTKPSLLNLTGSVSIHAPAWGATVYD